MNDFFELMKESMEYYYRTRDKFILIEYNYSSSGLGLKMSVVSGKEYIIIGNDMCVVECIKYLNKLYKEYDRVIMDVSIGLINCMNKDLNRQGLYLNLEQLRNEDIINFMKNYRLSAIGAYAELRQLKHNEKLIDGDE